MNKVPKELAEILDSKVTQKIYDDGLSQPVQKTGEVLVDIAKTIHLFAAPFQISAAYQDRLRGWIDRVIRNVPEDHRIPAHSRIAGPIFQELRYLDDGDTIAELYLNLLAKAIDRDHVNEAHPAFVKIIGFLSPDEVLMLHLLGQRNFEETYRSELDLDTHRFKNKTIILKEFPVQELVFPENYYVYTSHLISLNLVAFPVYKQEATWADGPSRFQTGEIGYARLTLTDFGQMFVKACEPTK